MRPGWQGPYETGEHCIDWKEYQRTMDIFDRVYAYYGMDKKRMKTPFHYSVYEWFMKIVGIVTGNFCVWDNERKYRIVIYQRFCDASKIQNFKALWNDILDVIEKHMDKIYDDKGKKYECAGDWYKPNHY